MDDEMTPQELAQSEAYWREQAEDAAPTTDVHANELKGLAHEAR